MRACLLLFLALIAATHTEAIGLEHQEKPKSAAAKTTPVLEVERLQLHGDFRDVISTESRPSGGSAHAATDADLKKMVGEVHLEDGTVCAQCKVTAREVGPSSAFISLSRPKNLAPIIAIRLMRRDTGKFAFGRLWPLPPQPRASQDESKGAGLPPPGAKAEEPSPDPPVTAKVATKVQSRSALIKGDFSRFFQSKEAPCKQGTDLAEFIVTVFSHDQVQQAKIQYLCPNYILVVHEIPQGVRPTSLLVRWNNPNGPAIEITTPFEVALPSKQHEFVFFDQDLKSVCAAGSSSGDPCAGTNLANLTARLVPALDLASLAKVEALRSDMVIVSVSAPIDYKPKGVIITNPNAGSLEKIHPVSVFLRGMPGPHSVGGQTNASFTIVDPETVKRNFGERISSRYIVIDLHVKNPGTKKIQFHKSAVWFEVDYVEAKHQSRSWIGKVFKGDVIYDDEAKTNGAVYRYGLEHQFQHFPHNFLSMLGTFDAIAGTKDRAFQVMDMLGSVSSGVNARVLDIANFTVANSLFNGVFLPRIRNMFFNPEVEKRKRALLLAQSFQDIIQIAPQSSTPEPTKLFLPRHVIAKDFPGLVLVRQVRDVHFDLEIVKESQEFPAAPGSLRTGMSQDQVIQSLGVPNRTDKLADGVSWVFDKGPFSKIFFNPSGLVTHWDDRPIDEQVAQLVGEGDTSAVKKILGLPSDPPPDQIKYLRNRDVVWVNPGALKVSLRFDAGGKLKQHGYQFLQERVTGLLSAGKPEAEIEGEIKQHFAGLGLDWENEKAAANHLAQADASLKAEIEPVGSAKVYPSDLASQILVINFKEKKARTR